MTAFLTTIARFLPALVAAIRLHHRPAYGPRTTWAPLRVKVWAWAWRAARSDDAWAVLRRHGYLPGLDPRPALRAALRAAYVRVGATIAPLWYRVAPYRYVTLYDRYRAYGGPEEGGWWYDVYSPVATHLCARWNAAERALDAEYGRLWRGYDAPVQGDVEGQVVMVEPHPARAHDTYSPWC